MQNAVIIDSVRNSDWERSLKNIEIDFLAFKVITELCNRTKIDKNIIDEIILGQAKQSADTSNLTRVASLRTGLPQEIPGYTVHRRYGSGVQAVNNAVQQIQ